MLSIFHFIVFFSSDWLFFVLCWSSHYVPLFFSQVQSVSKFNHSVVSNSLRPQGLQHARPPCPSPTPGIYSNSCPLSQWWHPTLSSSVIPFSSRLQSFPASGSVSNESDLPIRWPKCWSFSFSINPSNEYSGLISFKIDWFDLLVVHGTLKSLLQHHSSKASILPLYCPTLTSIHHYRKNHSWLYWPLSATWCLCFLIHWSG